MKRPVRNRSAEIIGGKIALLLLISVAAFSSAVKDLNSIRELAGSAAHPVFKWFNADMVHARGVSFNGRSCAAEGVAGFKGPEEFSWSGRVASGKTIEIKGINGDIEALRSAGAEIEVRAKRQAHNSDPNAVTIQVVEHAGGVTICAMYPPDQQDGKTACVPGSVEGRHQSPAMNARNNDVRVDFVIRVPAGVEFVGRTINGEITATSPSSNVDSRTVNGSLSISSTAYAKAKTVNRDILRRSANANSAGLLKFKTFDGEISANLPTADIEVKADPLSGSVSPGSPPALMCPVRWDHDRVVI